MILVTGATGFIGRALVRHLSGTGQQVRVLLRPSPKSPRIPKGVPVEVAVVSLSDERGVRAALRGVDHIYHLASAESQGRRGNLFMTDIEGTRTLSQAARDAGIQRLIYLSHLGEDRASAFPIQKAKGIAEEHIRQSGVPHTIIRSSVLFGPEDRLTNTLANFMRAMPFIFPIPGDGRSLLQPLWVEDLVTCLVWTLDNPETINATYEVGGAEYFSLRQVLETLMSVTHRSRLLVPLPIPWMRALIVMLDSLIPNRSSRKPSPCLLPASAVYSRSPSILRPLSSTFPTTSPQTRSGHLASRNIAFRYTTSWQRCCPNGTSTSVSTWTGI